MVDLDTAAAARSWLMTAAPGDIAVYHRGSLATDRYINPSNPPRDHTARLALGALAAAMFDACEHGLVELVQRRGEYLAIRTGRTEPTVKETYVRESMTPRERIARYGL